MIVDHFKELSQKQFNITNILIINDNNPFKVKLECYFNSIGKIAIEPFSASHFVAFREFYDGKHPEWGLTKQSRSFFDEHADDIKTLSEIECRVTSQQDSRFVVLLRNHIIGYLIIEEIDCIKAGKRTYFGEDYYAMLGIGISDRFHGSGLASFAILFLKYVAAIAGVGLGLVYDGKNKRAKRFYEKHGFIQKGYKEIFIPHTGERKKSPWYVLEQNEIQGRTD
jgi:ribosomal protein S18 acetylase RimI-like enzyme